MVSWTLYESSSFAQFIGRSRLVKNYLSFATNTFKHLLFTDDYINHLLTQELKENQAEIETYNIFHCLMKLVKGI